MPKIGAHVSASGSLDLAFDRAQEIGAECFQIFITPPQRWLESPLKDGVETKFIQRLNETKLGPIFTHGCYLINLATDNPENLKKAISWLTYAQNTAGKLGIAGTIFHLGSHKGRGFEAVFDQVCDSLKKILAKSPEKTWLILENSAGAGGSVGGKLSELGALIKKVGDPRLKVCLDTQHAFVSGYDLRTADGVGKMIAEFEQFIGLDRLAVIHANDSKTEFNSGRDRHENIGQGLIGIDGFKALINHPKLQNIPFILEVPGLEGTGPDKANIDFLHSLVSTI